METWDEEESNVLLESALDIDVQNKSYEQGDLENIHWISHLNYLDPNADTRECTAQGKKRKQKEKTVNWI